MNLSRFRKRPEPTAMATRHPLMQASIDHANPFWVCTDHVVWGTFDNPNDAIQHALRVTAVEGPFTRVVVSHVPSMETIYLTNGYNEAAKQAIQ